MLCELVGVQIKEEEGDIACQHRHPQDKSSRSAAQVRRRKNPIYVYFRRNGFSRPARPLSRD